MATVLLRNGKIIDGTGKPGFDGHVLIEGDRIKAVLRQNDPLPQADISIDVNGCAIAPGFIDVHSHLEGLLAINDHPKYLKCQLEQGITTIVGGNCGFSPTPVAADPVRSFNSYELGVGGLGIPLKYNWHTTAEFLAKVEQAKPAINLALLVGHGTLRHAIASTRHGLLKPDELQDCLKAVQRSFDEGACGLSFGLAYNPGMYSPNEEIEAFSKIAAIKKKPVAVHLRAYSRRSGMYPVSYYKPHNIRALQEMIDIAMRTGATLQVSHLMQFFHMSWSTAEQCLQVVEKAHEEGIDIAFDALPYTYVNGIIASSLPPWFQEKLPEVYQSKNARRRFAFENALSYKLILNSTMSDIRLMDNVVKGFENMGGLTIAEIAAKRKISQWEAILQLNEASHEQAAIIFYNINGDEKHTKQIDSTIAHKLCLIGSDALIRGHGYPNPAAFGTFPKVLGHYCRDKKLFSLEEAVRKMTSVSAERFGLKDRGVLATGKAADIVVFDPKTIAEGAPTASEPATRPIGMQHVFLNGTHVVKDGVYIDLMRAGKVLRT